MMEKPKKERRFLKTLGKIGEILIQEVLLKVGSNLVKRIGVKKNLPSILFLFLSISLFAQYPNTGNKQRLGFQTTADGLVWRGSISDTASIQPVSNQNAWAILDTVNLKIYSFDFTSNVWNQVGTGGGSAFTQPVDSLFFNVNVPTDNVDTAKMRWDSDLATVVLGLNDNVPNELGFKNFWLVKNQTGSTITKGSLVYANGTLGASGRITVAKFIANGTIDAKYLLGITAHDLSNGEDGYVISFGKIRKVNTDTFAAGAILYPSPTTAGVWTDVEPIAPNIDMPIGFCINSHVNNGTISIRVASGYALHELHDVAISSPVEKSSLYYSGGLWRDTTAALLVSDTASMLTNYLRTAVAASTYQAKLNGTGFVKASGTTITYDNSTYLTSSTGVTTFSAGSTGLTPSTATSGAITLGGTLALTNGGTGSTSASAARTALGATVRGANTFLLTDIGAISFLRYNADNTVSQRAADGMRSDLGGTTIGQSMFTLTNPSAVTFPRFNADNTVTALDAASFRTAIGAGTGTGTVTSVTGSLPISSSGGTTPNITIANAAVSTTGVVTATTQTFGGAKTFNGVLNASSDLNVTGLSTLTGGATIGTMSTQSALTNILGVNSSNAIGEIGLNSVFSLSSGVLNIQEAGASQRGIVTSTTQSFGGNKTFTDIVGFNKAIQRPIATITGNTTIQTSNCWIIVNNTGGTTTLTLPDATLATGSELMIKTAQPQAVVSASSNVVPLTFANNASTSILPATDGAWCTLVSNGTYWVIMQANF
jgi:hypothetical protein